MRLVNTRGASIAYEKKGKGRPIVFASGWAMGGGCWAPVIERFERRFCCVSYDPRGVGRSTADESASFDLEDHADDLAAICEAEGLFDAHLVGCELGGRVAALVARRRPQYASTVTIVGWWGAAQIRETLGGVERFRQAASLLLRDLGGFPVLRNLVAWKYRRVPEPHRTELFEQFAALDARAAYLTAVAASDPAGAAVFEDAAARLALPVLLVQGGEDREAARSGLRSLFESLPNVDLATIHGAGALPMLEHPIPFARTLSQFFDEHGPPQSLKK